MKSRSNQKPSRREFQKGNRGQRLSGRSRKDSDAPQQRKAKPAFERPNVVVGIVTKANWGWTLETTNRKDDTIYAIRNLDQARALSGELVTARVMTSTKAKRQEIEIDMSLGDANDPRLISLSAIYANEIPFEFPQEAVDEANAAKPVTLKGREDLRDIPLVTIDGEDARDFDDAVFAQRADKGWHIVVAIADVAHYVKPFSALDREAYNRGNSTYFPDRVVPMLPEALSNELCSLKPNVDRACMAVHMWTDDNGELKKWKFVRGVMKSRARLTYKQVQAAMNGKPDEMTAPLLNSVIKPLYGAYATLASARTQRGTLELDLPERQVLLNEDGSVNKIIVRERLDSHKLIEEFMICANVAAAAQLENRPNHCMYRIHDKPSEMKLEALRDFLDTIGIKLVTSKQLHPRMLTQILKNTEGTEHAQVVNEVMLRSQAQAVYSHENIGHFGLALAKYAHFTSPIRRYADLIVHRALIRTLSLGSDGLTDAELKRMEEIGDHISKTERRSIAAEREVMDRYTAKFLSDKVGEVFDAHISSVAKFGLFARLDETGADGIIPFSTLPKDYYVYNEKRHMVVGERSGRSYKLTQAVKVRLVSTDSLTGAMSFEIVEGEKQLKTKPEPTSRRKGKHAAVAP